MDPKKADAKASKSVKTRGRPSPPRLACTSSVLAIAAGLIIFVGLAGIGLNTRVGSLMSAGMWPLILGAVLVSSLSTTALFLVLILR